jgi:hypothetical protein
MAYSHESIDYSHSMILNESMAYSHAMIEANPWFTVIMI